MLPTLDPDRDERVLVVSEANHLPETLRLVAKAHPREGGSAKRHKPLSRRDGGRKSPDVETRTLRRMPFAKKNAPETAPGHFL
jgi:hypothetical protein